MSDSESENPWGSDDLTWRGRSDEGISGRLTEMRRELGRRDSPAFERLRECLRTPFEIPASVIAEIVQMLRDRCFADSQSFRKSRGKALWAELGWLNEHMLIEAFSAVWNPPYHQWWQISALAQHRSAGPALWAQVFSRRVDIKTVMDIVAEAGDRGARNYLAQLTSEIATLDIVSSAR